MDLFGSIIKSTPKEVSALFSSDSVWRSPGTAVAQADKQRQDGSSSAGDLLLPPKKEKGKKKRSLSDESASGSREEANASGAPTLEGDLEHHSKKQKVGESRWPNFLALTRILCIVDFLGEFGVTPRFPTCG